MATLIAEGKRWSGGREYRSAFDHDRRLLRTARARDPGPFGRRPRSRPGIPGGRDPIIQTADHPGRDQAGEGRTAGRSGSSCAPLSAAAPAPSRAARATRRSAPKRQGTSRTADRLAGQEIIRSCPTPGLEAARARDQRRTIEAVRDRHPLENTPNIKARPSGGARLCTRTSSTAAVEAGPPLVPRICRPNAAASDASRRMTGPPPEGAMRAGIRAHDRQLRGAEPPRLPRAARPRSIPDRARGWYRHGAGRRYAGGSSMRGAGRLRVGALAAEGAGLAPATRFGQCAQSPGHVEGAFRRGGRCAAAVLNALNKPARARRSAFHCCAIPSAKVLLTTPRAGAGGPRTDAGDLHERGRPLRGDCRRAAGGATAP